MPAEFMLSTLNKIQGTWYDNSGNPRYTFNGNLLNRNKIVGFYDAAGGGSNFGVKMRILVDGAYNDMKVSFSSLSSDQSRYHQYMTVNDNVYRRTPRARYYESIGGIYLGMPISDVYQLYGQPDVNQTDRHLHKVGYSKLGLMLDVRANIVAQITIFTYGDRKLDRTGLSASSSLDEFTEAYGMQRPAGLGHANAIGYSEYIWIKDYPRSVTLSLYCN
jgi:hypothetical protein